MDTLETLTHDLISTFIMFLILFGFKLISGLRFKAVADNFGSQDFSYKWKTSLSIALMAVTYYAQELFSIINSANGPEDEIAGPAITTAVFIVIWLVYISQGGTAGGQKTTTLVVSRLFEIIVGTMDSGVNWFDPIFERPTSLISLKKIHFKIDTTDSLQTLTGIRAWIKKISFMIQLTGNAKLIFGLEGELETIKERIHHCVDEFFIGEVGKLNPNDLDKDKKRNTLHLMEHDLELIINQFCIDNNYPYEVVDELKIGDTDLEPKYYEALAKVAIAVLEQEALDVSAEAMKLRLRNLGDYLMPGHSEAEKLTAAQISIGIIKKDISERKFSLDGDLSELVKEIAKIFKGV